MTRVSETALLQLHDELPARRWAILKVVAELRLVTGGQLRRCLYPEPTASAARTARRDLAAMHQRGILHRLQRRIGGVRAGSASYVWALGPVGRRLLELDRGEGLPGRSRYEPTVGFVTHALAVSQVWVDLHTHLRDPWIGEPEAKVDFRVERSAWRAYTDALGGQATLKPDAEVRLGRGDVEDLLWLEVDRATERRRRLHVKCAAVVAYFNTGIEQHRTGVFPLTVWLTTDEQRARVIGEVIAGFAPRDRRLFRVGLLSAAAPLLLSFGRDGA